MLCIHLQRDDSDFADFFGASDGGSFFGEIDEALKVKDPSVEYYPEPFCDMVAGEWEISRSVPSCSLKWCSIIKNTEWGIHSDSWVGLTMIYDVPPSCPPAQPLLPISHQPMQNQAEGGPAKIKVSLTSHPSRCTTL